MLLVVWDTTTTSSSIDSPFIRRYIIRGEDASLEKRHAQAAES